MMTVERERYRSIQLHFFSYPLHRQLGTLRSSIPLPADSLWHHLLCVSPSQSGGLNLVKQPYQAPVQSPPLHLQSSGCGTHIAIISQPPTSNLCISKPSVAWARPTPQLGSAQLVITDHSSSETSRLSRFSKKLRRMMHRCEAALSNLQKLLGQFPFATRSEQIRPLLIEVNGATCTPSIKPLKPKPQNSTYTVEVILLRFLGLPEQKKTSVSSYQNIWCCLRKLPQLATEQVTEMTTTKLLGANALDKSAFTQSACFCHWMCQVVADK